MRSKVAMSIWMFFFALSSSFLGGCCHHPLHFGESFRAAKHNQTLDPEAELNLRPVTGLDGVAAEREMESYRKSFEAKHNGGGESGSPVVFQSGFVSR